MVASGHTLRREAIGADAADARTNAANGRRGVTATYAESLGVSTGEEG